MPQMCVHLKTHFRFNSMKLQKYCNLKLLAYGVIEFCVTVLIRKFFNYFLCFFSIVGYSDLR